MNRPSPARLRRGFSLIEMLAVMLILVIITAVALPNLGIRSGAALREEAQRIAADLELARQQAIVTGVPHRLLIDLDQGGYRLEWRVTEAEASGEAPNAAAPAEWSDDAPLPLYAPRAEAREFRPVPTSFGRASWLEQDVFFAGVETAESWVDGGTVAIAFESDGSAQPTRILLEESGGETLALEIAPLADAVRIHHDGD